MRIIDTYSDIKSLFQSMNNGFNLEQWKLYADDILNGLSEKLLADSKGYDFENDILPVLNLVYKNDKLDEAHNSFLEVISDLNERIVTATGGELQVAIVFYVGLCNGAGWATELNGEKLILLGVEKIIELDWCDINNIRGLIYHEIGHIWHKTVGRFYQEIKSTCDKSIMQLYQEGIAMYFEQLVTNDFNHYHQNENNWLNWCIDNKKKIAAEYLKRLKSDESTQDFFGDWNNYQGYSNVGYFIGCEFVKRLAKNYTQNEFLNLDIDTIYKEFVKYAVNAYSSKGLQ